MLLWTRYEKALLDNWKKRLPSLVQTLWPPSSAGGDYWQRCNLAADRDHVALGVGSGRVIVWERLSGRQTANISLSTSSRNKEVKGIGGGKVHIRLKSVMIVEKKFFYSRRGS